MLRPTTAVLSTAENSTNHSTGNESTCHDFDANQVRGVLIAKVGVSAAAMVTCLLAIIVIVYLKQYRLFVHRLVLYLMVIGIFYGMIIGLEIAPVHHHGNKALIRDGFHEFCVIVAFLSQVIVWQFMLIFVWIIVYLLILAIFKYAANSKKQEILGIVVIVCFPLTFNWIPLLHDMYGLSGMWCWIKNTSEDCHSNYNLGLIYQYALFYGPLVLLILFSFVSFIFIITVVCKRRGRNLQALAQALPLLAHPIIYSLIALIMVTNRVYYAITTNAGGKPFYPLWFAHSLADPLQVLVVPIAFVLHPGTIRQLYKRLQRHRVREPTYDGTEFVVSQEYSGSEVDPLVIRGNRGYTHPPSSGYQSILEGNLRV